MPKYYDYLLDFVERYNKKHPFDKLIRPTSDETKDEFRDHTPN